MIETSDARNARVDVLREISRALAQPLDERGLLAAVHAELSRVIDTTICFFGCFDAASQTVAVVWQVHEGNELPGGQFPLGSGPTSEAIRSCRPRLIRDWSASGPRVHLQYATDKASLPESSIVVPVMSGGQVAGVLSVQSYQAAAYEEADVVLLEAAANLIALAMFGPDSAVRQSEADAVLASMDDALLVLDSLGRVVRLNRAARSLLCDDAGGVILGQPIDRAQAEHWPLGSEELSRRFRGVVEQLEHGSVPAEELEVPLSSGVVRCRTSLLRKGTVDAGAVIVLRKSD